MTVLQALLMRVLRSVALPHLAILVGVLLAVAFVWSTTSARPESAQSTPPSAEIQAPPSDPAPTPAATQPADTDAEPESSFDGIMEPPSAVPRRDRPITYSVQEGDMLWEISEQFGLRSETLVWANDLDDPDLLQVGQALIVPPVDGIFYTVQSGDRLNEVAERYGVDLGEVVEASELDDPDLVEAGAEVFLPGARPLRPAVDVVERDVPQIPLPANIDQLLAAGWLSAERSTVLFSASNSNSTGLHELPADVHFERLEGFEAGRIQVRDPGDGRTRQAMTGWVNAIDLTVGQALPPGQLPRAYPANTRMDIAHVFVPYRSQLDGSPYAQANCGPVAIGMALEAFGIQVSAAQLRAETQDVQRIWGNHVGSLITALASVVERHGLRTHGLYDQDQSIHQWTVEDVRWHVSEGHPVVLQVRYRSLPGRATSPYAGDHYILITGEIGDSFLYNDPIDTDGLGWDRLMSADQLRTAMNARDTRFAYAGFAVSR